MADLRYRTRRARRASDANGVGGPGARVATPPRDLADVRRRRGDAGGVGGEGGDVQLTGRGSRLRTDDDARRARRRPDPALRAATPDRVSVVAPELCERSCAYSPGSLTPFVVSRRAVSRR